MKNSSFNSRKFKGGAYTTILSVLVLFVVLVANLLVSAFSRTKDLTTKGTYSLQKDTLGFLKDYDTPIDIKYVVTAGQEDVVIKNTAENFANDGQNISISYIDPKQYPERILEYAGVGHDINNNSVIICNRSNPDRYVYLDAEQMMKYVYSQKDFQTKEFAGYCAESEILKALVEVSEHSVSLVYIATGHGERLLGDTGAVSKTFSDLLSLNAYLVKYVDLKKNPVPESCDVLMLLGPQNDFTEAECEEIKDYMSNGGKVIWVLGYAGMERPVQESLLNYYGLHMEEALLCEGDSNHTEGDIPDYILTSYGTKNAQWALGVGISKVETYRDSLEVSAVYTTTDQAYLKKDINNLAFGDGDKKAVYALLAKVSESYKNNTGVMYVFNTDFFFVDAFIKTNVSYANSDILLDTLGDLCQKQSSISIPDNGALEEALKLTTHDKNFLLVILVGAIPGLILLLGVSVVIIRRR